MKIAILHSGDLECISLGGVDRYLKSLIEFFDDDEITIYGTGKNGSVTHGQCYFRNYHGKTYNFIPITDDGRRPLSIYYMLCLFGWVAKMDKYDCIYAQRAEYSIPFILSKHKKKLIQLIHGSSKYSEIGFGSKLAKIHIFLEKVAISVASRTLIILNREEFGVPYYKKRYPKHAARISYALNPINTNIYRPQDKKICREKLGVPADRSVVIFTGRIENNPKRVLLLPEICRKMNEMSCQAVFLIVGDGADRPAFEDLVHKFDLYNQFIFCGYVEDTEMLAGYYNCADVAVNISMFEGTCTAILEAVACGTPVVSADVGDIHEIVNGNHNGIIVDNNQDHDLLVASVAEAIRSIIEDGIVMDKVYEKYEGTVVVEELRKLLCR